MTKTPDDAASMRARRDALSAQLAQKRGEAADKIAADAAQNQSMGDAGRAMSLGFRAVTELCVGLGVGTAIGWQLDSWLGTKPLLMLVFLFLGMGAGVWNVMRIANAPDKAPAANKNPPAAKDAPPHG